MARRMHTLAGPGKDDGELSEADPHLQHLKHGIVDGHKGVHALFRYHQAQPTCNMCVQVSCR